MAKSPKSPETKKRRFISKIILLLILGIVFNILVNWYPGFAEKFPTIYGLFEGLLRVVEFILKTIVKFIYSLVSWRFPEFFSKTLESFLQLWQQFVNWLAIL